MCVWGIIAAAFVGVLDAVFFAAPADAAAAAMMAVAPVGVTLYRMERLVVAAGAAAGEDGADEAAAVH